MKSLDEIEECEVRKEKPELCPNPNCDGYEVVCSVRDRYELEKMRKRLNLINYTYYLTKSGTIERIR